MEENTFFTKPYVQALLALVLAGVFAALAAYTYNVLQSSEYEFTGPPTISVTGEGEVLAVPDVGQFTFAVRAEGEDAAAAQAASAESINAIMAYLAEQGVEERDIRTQNYNLNPNYRYEERFCPVGSFCPPGEQVLDGFVVSQSVAVKVRDLDQAGDLISGVGERGATNISSLQFTIDDEEVLQAQAREMAIADAREKAQVLADDLGVNIVRIMGYWEEQMYPQPYGMGGGEMMMDKAMSAPSLPTGENQITSRVNITYVIR